MDNPEKLATFGYTLHNKTTQKHEKISNTNPPENWRRTQVLAKGKQFLLLIIHPFCYSYIQ
jgi:hypothetical protein